MTLFDRIIAVDWSAANTPKRGADSIWIADSDGTTENPPTRSAAMAIIRQRLLDALDTGQRVMLGFDFVFGYPHGAAQAVARAPDWQALWAALADQVEDDDDNRSNRFDVAATLNQRIGEPLFWGHPHGREYEALLPTKPLHGYGAVPERRMAELHCRGPQPVWKLTGVGSVGSQTLLGIARLEALRRDPLLGDSIAIWPFETDFERKLERPITVVEIYPSLFPVPADVLPRDRAQVEICVRRFAELDRAGLLDIVLSAPSGVSADDRQLLLAEEGWIAGVGHEEILLGAGRVAA